MSDEVIAVVTASAGRRFLGVTSLAILGILVIYVSLAQPPVFYMRVFLLVVGIVALWMADRIRRATGSQIELTEHELRDSSGIVIARIEDLQSIDRGFFAFKPSNGFLLKLKTPDAGTWRPGLWWRIGRRVGIGGMTPGSQTKFMSEVIAAMIAQRDMGAELGLSLDPREDK